MSTDVYDRDVWTWKCLKSAGIFLSDTYPLFLLCK